ncbi:M23 family metallopeptidase [Luteimicrobium subarcticum]|uniref:Peptidase M23-like protein n=1 Tax=Luteimicrobium subarcticum TaxID=620910 RepID=A0A2M8WU01_9MICO|nr:M23 family metallopeptidase [Luteimicrobium subarcticum]PJI94427.1 peptidase M23-like protein [Luteimicrobium subarcticum]
MPDDADSLCTPHAARRGRRTSRLAAVLAVVGALSAPVAQASSGAPGAAAGRTSAVAVPADDRQPGAYLPPVDGPLVHPFVAPAERWSAGHRGVDLGASVGALVRAPTAGVVTFRGTVAGRGVLTVLGDDGLRSSFEPVRDGVAAGTRVAPGDVVARLAPAATSPTVGHCAPDACLHWGVRRGETYVDPWPLVTGGPIVLLPVP